MGGISEKNKSGEKRKMDKRPFVHFSILRKSFEKTVFFWTPTFLVWSCFFMGKTLPT